MMKSSKVAHHNPRMHKPSRLSPMRKDLMMKKPSHSSSMRMNVSSRPPPMKHHLLPGMKRSPNMPPGKSMHSQRLRSIPSSPHRSLPRQSLQGPPMPLDRGHPMKSSKFDKRRLSPSPIHHPLGPSHGMKEPVLYQDERYLGRPIPRDSRFSPPIKKSRWESEDRYERGPSPNLRMMHHPEMAESRMAPHRGGMPSHSVPVPSIPNPSHRSHMTMSQHDRIEPYDMHSRSHPSTSPAVPASHSKRPPSSSMKQSYKDSRPERYRSPTPEERYLSPKDQHFYSLHERFSSVNSEPRIKYCLEELETITVDVHPPTIDSPRARRHINNQSGGKVVRRANDGHRSMFDRDEIKQASRDLREEAYYEKRSSNVAYGSMSVVKGVGKYEVRQKFESHSVPFHSTGGVSPSERWKQEDQKREGMNMDRDHREYERTVKKRFVDSRSKSGDQDFRSEKYSREVSRERPGYHSPHRMPSPDHRCNMPPIHRKEGMIQDARERLTARRGSGMKPHVSRSDSRGRYPSESEKHYSDGARADKHYIDRHSPETHKWPPKHRSESRERMAEYSHREEKYPPKSWPEKRDMSPRHSDFHLEPERYVESDSYRGRGGSRPFRARERGRGGFSTRSFRGGFRSSTSARGRGAPRRGRYSPGIWE